jgi:hypothetical protein
MPSTVFEPDIPATKLSHTYALDRNGHWDQRTIGLEIRKKNTSSLVTY